MATAPEHDFDQLTADWQAIDAPGPARDAIHRYVRSRTQALKIWVFGELLVAAVAIGALVELAITTSSSSDRLAALSLAVVAAVAAGASWVNWRGVLHATDRSTAEFIDLSVRRQRRMRRAHITGWVLLLVEVAVLTTWILQRTNLGDSQSTVLAWGLLVALTTLAVVFLLGFRRWLVRDERRLAELRAEFKE
jgi:hypothetical protein